MDADEVVVGTSFSKEFPCPEGSPIEIIVGCSVEGLVLGDFVGMIKGDKASSGNGVLLGTVETRLVGCALGISVRVEEGSCITIENSDAGCGVGVLSCPVDGLVVGAVVGVIESDTESTGF